MNGILGLTEKGKDKIEMIQDYKGSYDRSHLESYHAVIKDKEDEEKDVMVWVTFLVEPEKTILSFFDITEWKLNEELISESRNFDLEGDEDLLETVSRKFRDMIDEETVREDIQKTCLKELAILLIANKGKIHGKGIIDELRQNFGLSISAGTMYPMLQKLEEKGILEKHEGVKSKKYSLKDKTEALDIAKGKIQSVFSIYLLLHQLYKNYEG